MRAIFIILLFVTGPLLLYPAQAQQPRVQQKSPLSSAKPVEQDVKRPDFAHQSRSDQLFERLAAAKDEVEAGSIAEQINGIWARSGSDTLDLLMTRAGEALAAKDTVLALDVIDSVLALKSDWAEVYNRRAAIHFQRQDFDAAVRDLRQTLILEPRHFQALAGVGMIFQQGGNGRQALAAFNSALKLNPHLKGIKQAAEKLSLEYNGQGI
jgi:tetratricopeptide (TPR) repeat protein